MSKSSFLDSFLCEYGDIGLQIDDKEVVDRDAVEHWKFQLLSSPPVQESQSVLPEGSSCGG